MQSRNAMLCLQTNILRNLKGQDDSFPPSTWVPNIPPHEWSSNTAVPAPPRPLGSTTHFRPSGSPDSTSWHPWGRDTSKHASCLREPVFVSSDCLHLLRRACLFLQVRSYLIRALKACSSYWSYRSLAYFVDANGEERKRFETNNFLEFNWYKI